MECKEPEMIFHVGTERHILGDRMPSRHVANVITSLMVKNSKIDVKAVKRHKICVSRSTLCPHSLNTF